MNAKKTYNRLFNLVEKHITHYREDLTKHDLNSIEKRPGVKFIHITRKTGTCIIFLSDIQKDLKEIQPGTSQTLFREGTTTEEVIKGKHTFIDYYLNEGTRKAVIYFDGQKLTKTTPEKARKIFKDYSEQELRKARIKEAKEKRKQERQLVY